MAIINFKTKGDGSPVGKPRVLFTCHPDDFNEYFPKVCDDLHKTHDCAIYYTPDMDESLTDDNRMDMIRSQLIVVVVTHKLLTTKNRTMDVDIPFALKNNIRILPLMVESDSVVKIYSREDKFGHLQYLEPNSEDPTQIPYEQKLKNYLDNVLVSDELAEKIRGAFSAYMFLSYRKKDRKLARSLMKMIHQNEKFWDIAIWFDEFLIPGEAFDKTIDKFLERSRFFTLLVTPNLMEANNYAMSIEYSKACHQKDLLRLPVEMEKTDLDQLAQAHPTLPKITDCADPTDESMFNCRLLTIWEQAKLVSAEKTPWKEYLIGMAYMEGIDMETDSARGIAMIRSAAEAGLAEAMRELMHRHDSGSGVPLDWKEAERWGKMYCDACIENCGEKSEETINALGELGEIQVNLCKYTDAQNTIQLLYDRSFEIYGASSEITVSALHGLAEIHRLQGNYIKAAEELERLNLTFSNDDHSLQHIAVLNSLAMTYQSMDMCDEALKKSKKVFDIAIGELGSEHPFVFVLRENLGMVYADLKRFDDAIKTLSDNLELRKARLPKDHPNILTTINDLAVVYGNSGDYRKGLELSQEAYDRRVAVLGETHPDTLTSMNNLAVAYQRLDEYSKALEYSEKECELSCKILGETHPDALISMHNLAMLCASLAQYKKAEDLMESAYKTRLNILGSAHQFTMKARRGLAKTKKILGKYDEALELFWESHKLYTERFGEEHPETLYHLEMIAGIQIEIGTEEAHQEAEQILANLYERMQKNLPALHPDIYRVLNLRSVNFTEWGKLKEAIELEEMLLDSCSSIKDLRTADIISNLSKMHTRLGNIAKQRKDMSTARKEHTKAIALGIRAYTICCELFGKEHPETLEKQNALAVAQGELGDYKKAMVTMRKVYELRCKVLGKNHLDTIDSLSNLAGMQSFSNDRDSLLKALKKDQEVWKVCSGILGESHPTSLRYLDNLANTYYRLKMERELLDTDELLYKLRKKSQGMKHMDTYNVLICLQNELRTQKKYGRLLELIPEALEISRNVHGENSEEAMRMEFQCAVDYCKYGNPCVGHTMLEKLYDRCCKVLGEEHSLAKMVLIQLHIPLN